MFTSVVFRLGAVGFILLGAITTVVALAFLSEATMGVGIIGIGCFLGICGRMLQAAAHQVEDADSAKKRHSGVEYMLEQIFNNMGDHEAEEETQVED